MSRAAQSATAKAPVDGNRVSAPVLYEVDISHTRTDPLRHGFDYQSYLWFVDIDQLPVDTKLATFRASDHLGDPDRSIRANVDAFLADRGLDLVGGRVLLLTQARVLGHVFNPLSVYWCHYPTGEPACVIAEVHNTYGQRHAYLLRTDELGRARVPKEFYVSPFNPVEGEYAMMLPVPGEQLSMSITLHRPGMGPFVASVRGNRVPATRSSLLRMARRHPVAPLLAAARIRRHGITLWLRGMRPQPRPPHQQKGVQ